MLEELEKRLETAAINRQDAAATHSMNAWAHWNGQHTVLEGVIALLKRETASTQ